MRNHNRTVRAGGRLLAVFLTLALVLGMAPAAAFASEPAEAVFSVYTADNGTPEDKTLVKSYTAAEFAALATGGEPVSGMFFQSGAWRVSSTNSYVTIEDLFEDAAISREWRNGASFIAVASDDFASPAATYETITTDSWFYPNLGVSDAATSASARVAMPAVLALAEMSGPVTTTTAAAQAANLAALNTNNAPRLLYGIKTEEAVAKSAAGRRYGSNVATITLVKSSAPLPEVNKAALDTAIAKAGALIASDYLAEGWAALQTALTAAKVVKDNTDASQAKVDAAASALDAAIAALVKVPVDKAALDAAIAKAGALIAGDYLAEGWTAVQTALTAAKAVKDNTDASQAEVNAAVSALNAAVAALVKAPPKVTAIKFGQQNINLVRGRIVTVMPEVYVAEDVKAPLKWTSSNTKVATVTNSGKIKAVKVGSARITATAENGQKATLNVKVVAKNKAVKVTSVKINAAPKTLKVGKTRQLRAAVSPAKATGAVVKWKSSNARTLKVDQTGRITAVKPGKANITLTVGGRSVRVTVQVKR